MRIPLQVLARSPDETHPNRLQAVSGPAILYFAFLTAGTLAILGQRTTACVVLMLVCLAYLLGRGPWRTPNWSWETSARSWLFLSVASGTLLPGALGWLATSNAVLEDLGRVGDGTVWLDLILFTLVIGGILFVASRWPASLPDLRFLVLVALVFFVVKVAYVHFVIVTPTSDFAGMWRIATSAGSEGLEASKSSDDYLDHMHLDRSLPYFLPLSLVFGASRTVYVLPNVLVTVLCSLLSYRLTRRWFGRRAGRVAFALSITAIEPILAANIPTHDIPGALFTLLALWIFTIVDDLVKQNRMRSALLPSVLLGAILVAVDLQRSTRPILLLSFALYLVLNLAQGLDARRSAGGPKVWPGLVRHFACLLIAPLLIVGAGELWLNHLGLRSGREMMAFWRNRGMAALSDSWSDATYRYANENYYKRYPQLTAEDWGRLSRRKLASDLYYNPGDRIGFVIRKSGALYRIGQQLYFYTREAHVRGASVETMTRPLKRLVPINRCFSALFLGLLLCGLVSVWRDMRIPGPALLPSVYLAILSGFLILWFEVQPRYLFQIWYIGAIYAGALFRSESTEVC